VFHLKPTFLLGDILKERLQLLSILVALGIAATPAQATDERARAVAWCAQFNQTGDYACHVRAREKSIRIPIAGGRHIGEKFFRLCVDIRRGLRNDGGLFTHRWKILWYFYNGAPGTYFCPLYRCRPGLDLYDCSSFDDWERLWASSRRP
jgi:hypothetical protein